MMARLLKVGTKLGIVGAAVYYSVESGVWDDSARTEQLYQELYTAASPLFNEVPVEVPEFPKSGDISRVAVEGWNRGVLATTRFLVDLPSTVYNLGQQGTQFVSEQLNK